MRAKLLDGTENYRVSSRDGWSWISGPYDRTLEADIVDIGGCCDRVKGRWRVHGMMLDLAKCLCFCHYATATVFDDD